MNRIFRTLLTCLFTLFIAGCGSEKQHAAVYYSNIATIYVKTEDALKADLAALNSTTDSMVKKQFTDKIEQQIIASIQQTKKCQLSSDDFGLKDAVLADFNQTLTLLRQGLRMEYLEIEDIDEVQKWFENYEKELNAKVQRIKQRQRTAQSQFIEHYKMTVDNSRIKAAAGINQGNH